MQLIAVKLLTNFSLLGLAARLKNVVDSDFAQITYTEAVDILQSEIAAGKVAFERYPNWGDDLGSEHERYITEKVFNKPTIVINYPKGPFESICDWLNNLCVPRNQSFLYESERR